jgi:hypothetical protein
MNWILYFFKKKIEFSSRKEKYYIYSQIHAYVHLFVSHIFFVNDLKDILRDIKKKNWWPEELRIALIIRSIARALLSLVEKILTN